MILEKYQHLKTPSSILRVVATSTEQKRKKYPMRGTSFFIESSLGSFNFLNDSIRYAKRTHEKVPHVPLQVYFPTFEHLNEEQQAWYFYWRNECIQGRYLDTDLSYIFLFVYELLNYGFHLEASFNISHLVHLYENYKERQPKITRYLPGWISDMLIEVGEIELAYEWWNPLTNNQHEDYSFFTEHLVEFDLLSINKWKKYMKQSRETEFFRVNKTLVYRYFKESLPFLQKYYAERGENILDHWFSSNHLRATRYLFRSALLCRKAEIHRYQETNVSVTDDMYQMITQLLRVAENIARKVKGEKKFIKVIESYLPTGLPEQLTSHFEQLYEKEKRENEQGRFKKVQSKQTLKKGSTIPKPPELAVPKEPEITILFDFEHIQTLHQQSQELQTIFEERYEEEEEETVITDNKPLPTAPIETDISTLFHTEEQEDVDAFVNELTALEKQFLQQFDEGSWDSQEATSFLRNNGIMLGMFLTDLNEKAEEYLGDLLIEEDGDELEITEEFLGILTNIRGLKNED